MPPARIVLIATALLIAAGPAAVSAADVRVSYLVDARILRREARADTSLVVTAYADRLCTSPVAARVVAAGDLEVIEKLRRLALRSTPRAPETARLTTTLVDLELPLPAYVTITGTGISPIGGACQLIADAVVATGDTGCPGDAVALGPVCVDKYEASVWSVPAEQVDVLAKIRRGTVTHADLVTAGATQIREASTDGCAGTEYPPSFPLDGNYTAPLYAVSIPGVLPSNCLTARQATAACALSGKRLLSGSEWFHAAAGTPPPDADDLVSDCALASPGPVPTGSRAACVSTVGAHDMLGNLYEWTNVFDTTLDAEGRAWIIGAAFNVGTGFPLYPASLSGPIAIHTDTGFRCAR